MGRRHNRYYKHNLSTDRRIILPSDVFSFRILWNTFLKKTRNILLYSFVTCLLIVLSWGVIHSGKALFIRGDRFGLNEVVITPPPSADSFFNNNTFTDFAGLSYGESIFTLNPEEIEAKLLTRPEIDYASVTRRLPGSIAISLREKTPIAKFNLKGQTYLVSSENTYFPASLAPPSLLSKLPLVKPLHENQLSIPKKQTYLKNIGLLRASKFIQEWNHQEVPEFISSIKVQDHHSILVKTSSGAKLTFGYYEHARQIRDYRSIIAFCKSSHYKIKVANLLPFKNIPITFDKIPRSQQQSIRSQIPRNKPKFSPQEDILMILNQG